MSHARNPIPILGICAYSSGMGKTTLMEAILPILRSYGLRVAVIKQARVDFDVDRPGKDSFRIREAGASQVLLGSSRRWVMMTELEDDMHDGDGLPLQQLAQQVDQRSTDMILVEGFKSATIPKIEVFRASCGTPLLMNEDLHVIAVASDTRLSTTLPVLDLNASSDVADFILDWLAIQQGKNIIAVAA